jgi:S-formylglutathione hydrolase FrmB
MGGYGALKAALGKPEKYAAVAVLSCVADPVALGQGGFSAEVTSPADMTGNITRIFGGAEKFYGSDNDLAALLRGLDKTDGPKPAVFQCCGAEDFLLSQNRDLNSLFSREIKTIHHTYREGPGGHNWAYWNRALPGVFEFFGFPDKSPLTEA